MKENFGHLDVFNKIYADSYWGKGSGGGSSPEATAPYKFYLEDFIRRNNVRSIVDLGCGDWQFSKFVDFDGATYLGIDASKQVIQNNKREFSSTEISFADLPGDYKQLPSADLLLCKDVLQHLDTEEIQKILQILPHYKFALITNDVSNYSVFGKLIQKMRRPSLPTINREIKIGDYRQLDPTRNPFNLKLKKVLEWKVNPLSVNQRLQPINLILGKDCEWVKRTYLHEKSVNVKY